jgi:hypothetical protein
MLTRPMCVCLQVKKTANAKLKQACEAALTEIGDGSQPVGTPA